MLHWLGNIYKFFRIQLMNIWAFCMEPIFITLQKIESPKISYTNFKPQNGFFCQSNIPKITQIFLFFWTFLTWMLQQIYFENICFVNYSNNVGVLWGRQTRLVWFAHCEVWCIKFGLQTQKQKWIKHSHHKQPHPKLKRP